MAQIADKLDVAKQQLWTWAERHAEFKDALTRAKTAEQAYFERLGHEGFDRQSFNDRLWRTTMQARFREDYTERQIVQTERETESESDPRQLARALLAIISAAAPQITENKQLSPRDRANVIEATVAETLGLSDTGQ